MSSSAINAQLFQAKAGSIQNQADSSSIYSSGQWSFKNSNAVASVTITDAGNVGIGTASPSQRLVVASNLASTAIEVYNTNTTNTTAKDSKLNLVCTDTAGTAKVVGSLATAIFDANAVNGSLVFSTRSSDSVTEKMRIDYNGNLLVGTTNVGISNSIGTTVESSGLNNARITVNHSSSGSSNDSNFLQFGYGGSLVGRISQASTSSVSYITTSDYRLKENVQPIVAALSRVSALKPCTYKWKLDGSESEGFIAHELAEVCPLAVAGEKDAVNEDGSVNPQGIDPSKLVGLLTAAIQELSAKNGEQSSRIEALEARLAALESK